MLEVNAIKNVSTTTERSTINTNASLPAYPAYPVSPQTGLAIASTTVGRASNNIASITLCAPLQPVIDGSQ